MANVGTTRTRESIWHDTLLQAHHPKTIRYHATVIGGSFPAGAEIFVDGEEGNRLYIPTNCVLAGTLTGVAWNLTTPANFALDQIFFSVTNTNGTVAFGPASFGGMGNNPGSEYTHGSGGWSVEANDALKALVVKFTALVGDTFKAAASLEFVVAGESSSFSNAYSVVDNS